MGIEIIRSPYLLYETVELLYKFVNGISFRSLLSLRLAADNTEESEWTVRLAEQLQEILKETCRGLDPSDPLLRRFFARAETSDRQEGTCLARFLTVSLFTLKEADFWKNVEQIRANWWHLQEKGAWIQGYSIVGLQFSFDEGCPGDLLEQVCGLELPAEFQLSLCRALRDFDRSLDALAELIWPIAQRLEETIRKADWLLDEKVTYWRNLPVSPLDYVSEMVGQPVPDAEGTGPRWPFL